MRRSRTAASRFADVAATHPVRRHQSLIPKRATVLCESNRGSTKRTGFVVDGATGVAKGYAQPIVNQEVQDDVVPGQAHPGVIAD